MFLKNTTRYVENPNRKVKLNDHLTVQTVEPPKATNPPAHAVQGGKPPEPNNFFLARGWEGGWVYAIVSRLCRPDHP